MFTVVPYVSDALTTKTIRPAARQVLCKL